MKSFLTLILCSVLVGLGLGAALGYFEARPASLVAQESEKEATNSEAESEASEQRGDFPKIVFSEKIYNFDRIERGTSMQHDFIARNDGTAPLYIRFESNTCKCTGVKLGGRLVEPGGQISVPPGKETQVTLEWAAKTPAGPFRHGARFRTNDPRESFVELSVDGQVVESTSMKPSELLFGEIDTGDSAEASLYLMSFLDQNVEVLEHEVTPAGIAEKISIQIDPAEKSELPSEEALSGVKVSATCDSGKFVGPFRGWLTLKTNLPGAEKLSIPIMGSVTGPVSIYGPRWNSKQGLLSIGPVISHEGKTVKMLLSVSGDKAMGTKFEVASVDPPELKVSLGEPKEMGDKLLHYPIILDLPPYTRPIVRMGEPASTDAVVVFKSNHPQAKEVRMRVHFAITQ